MDNTISKLLEYFKHIARDLLIYLLSGAVVIANLALIDYQYNGFAFFKELSASGYILWILLIAGYVLGHIVMGMLYILFEKSKFEEFIRANSPEQKKEMKIFIENQEAYEYFIERQNLLYYVRWTLSGAFLLNFIINFCFLFKSLTALFSYITYAHLISFLILFSLHYKTAKDYKKAIDNLMELNRDRK